MKRRTLVSFLTLAAISSCAGVALSAGAAPAPEINAGTRVYTQADVPDGNADMYPEKAQENEVDGAATVSCQVGEGYRMARCIVLQEKPAGYGFGEATALKVLKYGKAEPDKNKPGDWLRVTLNWSLR